MSARQRAAKPRKPTAADKTRSDLLLAEHLLSNAETDILDGSRLDATNWAEIMLRALHQVRQARLVLIAAADEVTQ